MNDDFLLNKLNERKEQHAFRQLRLPDGKIDFCSNDYLGIVRANLIGKYVTGGYSHGATGSRLLSGNYPLIMQTEKIIAAFHDARSGLLFNSGYDANVGLLSCVPQRGDTIIYDQLSHASIRDGIRLSFAQSFSFDHNSVDDLEGKLRVAKGNIFVVTESVFSMDGDMAPIADIIHCCEKYHANLIVDEAHATGVIGDKGEGLMQERRLHRNCFARIHTFGKAVGCHGAIVLGSETLRDYLINFSRAFIYTTALPETGIAAIEASYKIFPEMRMERKYLRELIHYFQEKTSELDSFRSGISVMQSFTPIQIVIVPGNEQVRSIAKKLSNANLDVRPILYPTVPRGRERLRIVLHSFNTKEDVDRVVEVILRGER